ncbi:MAG: OmcA/MtrC family decaheme c-type cytochrome [Myxococcales bacterium]|nr:OmcA/MtrC family decaheme c-type cytochrome [Myxococcales bacterium]
MFQLRQWMWVALASCVFACGDDEHGGGADGGTGPCSVRNGDAGAVVIRCDDGSEVTIAAAAAGRDGRPGDAGERGRAGPAGEAGMDAAGCKVTDREDRAVITCPDGSSATLGPPPAPDAGRDAGRQRPAGAGLVLTLLSVEIDRDEHPVVSLRISDADGVGLDRAGRQTAGEVSLEFTFAVLRAHGFESYLLSEQTSPVTNVTESLPSADGAGDWAIVDGDVGTYRYRFSEPLPSGYDPAATHRIGVWGARTVSGLRYAADAVIDFRPDAQGDLERRQVATTEGCNRCHERLAAHGSWGLSVELCLTCHTDQGVDPDTGNSIDFKVMVHKIHMGRLLPSVQAGLPYQLVGEGQTAHDYSRVGFPTGLGHCATCHDGQDAAAARDRVSIEACGSCHDDIDFDLPPPDPDPDDLPVPHTAGPRDNASCTVCHREDGLEGLAVQESHGRGRLNPNTPTLTVEIVGVADTAPDQQPTVEFVVRQDGQGRDLLTAPLDQLRVVLAGPTVGITGSVRYQPDQASDLSTGSMPGAYRYTLPDTMTQAAGRLDPVPASAAGSFAIMIEGHHTFTGVEHPFANTSDDVRVGWQNPVAYFAVTEGGVQDRRVVVTNDKCNACHRDMRFHDDASNSVQGCVLCHNAYQDTVFRMPAPDSGTVASETVQFGPMIHRIHGHAIAREPYVLYADTLDPVAGGAPLDLSEVGYPGTPESCETCHIDGTYDLPLSAELPNNTTRFQDATGAAAGVARDVPPAAASCGGCHDDRAARDHAQVMTTAVGGEACATCHASGSAFGVDVVHTRPPWAR